MSRPTLIILLPIILSVLVAPGCSIPKISLNAGQTDYAFVSGSVDADPDADTRCDSRSRSKGCIACGGDYSKPTDYHKFTPKYSTHASGAISEGESISVHLKQAFVKDFSERLERFVSKALLTQVRGEIAVLARVYELDDGGPLSFGAHKLKKGGRLIYYSEDVRSGGHFLNLSQLPIFGPTKYKGGALVMQFTVLELDMAESAQLKGLLTTLAAAGASIYPPASKVLSQLDEIGSKLLDGEQDDLEFRYDMILHPAKKDKSLSESHSIAHAILKTGDYVIIKEQPKSQREYLTSGPFDGIPWDKLLYNPKSGRVFQRKEPSRQGDCHSEYRDESYLVVQINSGLPSIKVDAAQQWETFEPIYIKEAVEMGGASVGEVILALSKKFEKTADEGKIKTQKNAAYKKLVSYFKRYARAREQALIMKLNAAKAQEDLVQAQANADKAKETAANARIKAETLLRDAKQRIESAKNEGERMQAETDRAAAEKKLDKVKLLEQEANDAQMFTVHAGRIAGQSTVEYRAASANEAHILIEFYEIMFNGKYFPNGKQDVSENDFYDSDQVLEVLERMRRIARNPDFITVGNLKSIKSHLELRALLDRDV